MTHFPPPADPTAAERGSVRDGPLSVVIAAGDLGGRAAALAAAWVDQLRRIGNPFELLLVDGAESALDRPADVTTVASDSPGGLGAALRAGVERAAHPLVVIVVPEFAFRPHELRALLQAAEAADVVVGVRPGQPRPRWLEHGGRLLQRAGRVVVGIEPTPRPAWYGWPHWRRRLAWRGLFGLRLQDPECGLLVVRQSLLQRCPIQSQGRFALVELLAKLNFAGALMAEAPLTRGGDLPVVARPFAECAGDRRRVFRRPTFRPRPAAEAQTPTAPPGPVVPGPG